MKSIVVANWKMHPATFKEAKQIFEATRKAAEKGKGVSVIVAPPSIFLREIVKLYKGRRVAFAMQDAHPEAVGAFTGEVSVAEGKDAKAAYVIVAHAERRAMGETNDSARLKVAATLNNKMTPILCIGETHRDATGEHFNIIKEQLRIALTDIPAAKVAQVVIAYEPVWAIGATRAMEPRDMHEMAIFIRKSVVETHGKDGMNMKILYGGSIDETNAAGMLRDGDVAGFLVGRASIEPEKFALLIHSLSEA